jgi:hypothetical protein
MERGELAGEGNGDAGLTDTSGEEIVEVPLGERAEGMGKVGEPFLSGHWGA